MSCSFRLQKYLPVAVLLICCWNVVKIFDRNSHFLNELQESTFIKNGRNSTALLVWPFSDFVLNRFEKLRLPNLKRNQDNGTAFHGHSLLSFNNSATRDRQLVKVTAGNAHVIRRQENSTLPMSSVQFVLIPRDSRPFESFIQNCCLNNIFMYTMCKVYRGCQQAQRNDVVLLPPDLDDGGKFRTSFRMFDDLDIENLKMLALEKFNCRLVSKSFLTKNVKRREYTFLLSHSDPEGLFLGWFYSNMKLPPHLADAARVCGGFHLGISTAVHLRIEEDWQGYCAERQSRKDSVKTCYTPFEIATALKAGLPHFCPNISSFFLVYGQVAPRFAKGSGNHPAEVWPRVFSQTKIFHKMESTHCLESIKGKTYNEKAMLDMWLAVTAQYFIGISMSTWSNGVSRMRYLRGKNGSNFLYSCPKQGPVVLRKDTGIFVRKTDGETCRRNSMNTS